MEASMPNLCPFSSFRSSKQHYCCRNRDKDDHPQVFNNRQLLDSDSYNHFQHHADRNCHQSYDCVEVTRQKKINSDGVVKNQTHSHYLHYNLFTFDVPNAEQGYPVWLSFRSVGICKNKGIILIYKACSKFWSWKSIANCLNTKNNQSNSIGMIEVLIFFITTNLIMVPATKIAMRSFINQESMKIYMSVAMMSNPMNADML
jgi:hypothetical protein